MSLRIRLRLREEGTARVVPENDRSVQHGKQSAAAANDIVYLGRTMLELEAGDKDETLPGLPAKTALDRPPLPPKRARHKKPECPHSYDTEKWLYRAEWHLDGVRTPGQLVEVRKELPDGKYHDHRVIYFGIRGGVPSFLDLAHEDLSSEGAMSQTMCLGDLDHVIGNSGFRVLSSNIFAKMSTLTENQQAEGLSTMEWLCTGKRAQKDPTTCECTEAVEDIQELWSRYLYAELDRFPGDGVYLNHKDIDDVTHALVGVYLGVIDGSDMILYLEEELMDQGGHRDSLRESPAVSDTRTEARVTVSSWEQLSQRYSILNSDARIVPLEATPSRLISATNKLLKSAKSAVNQPLEYGEESKDLGQSFLEHFAKNAGYKWMWKPNPAVEPSMVMQATSLQGQQSPAERRERSESSIAADEDHKRCSAEVTEAVWEDSFGISDDEAEAPYSAAWNLRKLWQNIASYKLT